MLKSLLISCLALNIEQEETWACFRLCSCIHIHIYTHTLFFLCPSSVVEWIVLGDRDFRFRYHLSMFPWIIAWMQTLSLPAPSSTVINFYSVMEETKEKNLVYICYPNKKNIMAGLEAFLLINQPHHV